MPAPGSGALSRFLLPFSAFLLAATAAIARDEEPLEPDRAFPVTARVIVDGPRATVIDLRFAIRDGYYLYVDRFRIEAPGLPLGVPGLPVGIDKDDPFVGKSRILKGDATVHLPLRGRAAAGEHVVLVTAQGCAEGRVCYTPFTQEVRVTLP